MIRGLLHAIRSGRAAASAALLVAVLSGTPGLAGAASAEAAEEQLAGALASGEASRLRSLLPRDSKVFLQMETVRRVRGYYGANQVIRVFDEFFEAHAARGFEVTERSRLPSETGLHLRGRLAVESSSGEELHVALVFVLTRGPDGWSVREVREGS